MSYYDDDYGNPYLDPDNPEEGWGNPYNGDYPPPRRVRSRRRSRSRGRQNGRNNGNAIMPALYDAQGRRVRLAIQMPFPIQQPTDMQVPRRTSITDYDDRLVRSRARF